MMHTDGGGKKRKVRVNDSADGGAEDVYGDVCRLVSMLVVSDVSMSECSSVSVQSSAVSE